MQAGCICSGKLTHISAAYYFRTWIVTAQGGGVGLGWGGGFGNQVVFRGNGVASIFTIRNHLKFI